MLKKWNVKTSRVYKPEGGLIKTEDKLKLSEFRAMGKEITGIKFQAIIRKEIALSHLVIVH